MSPVLAHSAIGALTEPASDDARHRRSTRERLDAWRAGLDRRAHRRLTPREYDRLREARLKYGPAVELLDLSAGGVQFETSVQLRPGTDVVLHLTGEDLDTLMPSRVVRCHVSKLNGCPSYRSGVVFRRSLDLPDLIVPSRAWMNPPPGDYVKTEFALKAIVDRYIGLEASAGRETFHDRAARMLLEALHQLQASAEQRNDPANLRLAELLARVLPAFREGESVPAVLTRIEEQLRQAVPLVTIRVADAPVAPGEGAESFYFDITGGSPRSPGVLNVEFPGGFAPDASQFRLLKASAYLMTLLRACHRQTAAPVPQVPAQSLAAPEVTVPPPGAASRPILTEAIPARDLPEGWHRVVVRFTDGMLLRGYTNDFHASRRQLHLSRSPGVTADRLVVPISRAKAVFFVRDLAGDPSRVDQRTFTHAARGRRLEVTFDDGEVLLGSTLNYQPDGQGFFLEPADAGGNNIRVFVLSNSVRHARFLPAQF